MAFIEIYKQEDRKHIILKGETKLDITIFNFWWKEEGYERYAMFRNDLILDGKAKDGR